MPEMIVLELGVINSNLQHFCVDRLRIGEHATISLSVSHQSSFGFLMMLPKVIQVGSKEEQVESEPLSTIISRT